MAPNTFAATLDKLTLKQVSTLPPTIREMIIRDMIPKNTILLQVIKHKPHTYQLSTFLRQERYAIFYEFLKRLQQSHTLPDGTYVLNFRDHLPKYAAPCPIMVYAANKELVACGKQILMPDYSAMRGYTKLFAEIDNVIDKYNWASKTDTIFWRGATTGKNFKSANIDNLDRVNLINNSRKFTFVDAEFSSHGSVKRNNTMPPNFFKNYPLHPRTGIAESLAYKYLIAVDGNTCTYSRLAWILYSNSVLLKHDSDDVQWYYALLKPYTHYLPIDKDFSNLEQQYNWAQKNATQSQAIAMQGRELASEIFSDQAIFDAFIVALDEYNALLTGQNVK